MISDAYWDKYLERKPYYLFGLPIDFISIDDAVGFIERICSEDQITPRYLVTGNLHYVLMAWKDKDFRDAVIGADLCSPDGVPLIWASMFLNIPHQGRVAGADLLPELIKRKLSRQYEVFIFGTSPDSAEAAQKIINRDSNSLKVVDFLSPGIGSVEELSKDEYIKKINGSGAEILIISLDAEKALKWISLNRSRLKAKFVCQMGAAVDFLSGKTKRAPEWVQNCGLEWLYRFIQEPRRLWRRYLNDGLMLIRLFFRYMLPCKVLMARNISKIASKEEVHLEKEEGDQRIKVTVKGPINAFNYAKTKSFLHGLLKPDKDVELDLSGVNMIDNAGLGMLFMFKKMMREKGKSVSYMSISKTAAQAAKYNLFDFEESGPE